MTSMNKVFADLPVTIFEAMSQLARDNNAINLGQGFPDDPGPEDIRRAAADAVMDGYNQYPSMMGIPELRQAIAAHYGRWHGLSARSDDRGDGDLGRHRGADHRPFSPWSSPATRSIVFQPVYDSYLPIIRQAGGIPRLRAARAAALAADRGGAAQRLQPQDQGGAVQQSAQSRRGGLSARGPRIAGAVLPGVRHDRDLRRGLGARDLRRPRAYSADHHSRHARPHHQGRLRRQDLFADRLEDRLCLRRAAAAARGGQGAPVSHLHHRAQSSGRGRLRPRQAGGLFSTTCARSWRGAATV